MRSFEVRSMAAKKKIVMDYVGNPPREIKEKEDFYGFELD